MIDSNRDPRKVASLHRFLLALALACLFPVLALSGWAVWASSTSFRETAAKRLEDTSVALAGAIENELANRFAVLGVLGPALEGEENAPHAPVATIVDDLVPRGRIEFVPLHGGVASANSHAARALATIAQVASRPQVSNVSFRANGVPIVSIAVPAPSPSGEAGTFVQTLSPRGLIGTLERRSGELNDILVAVTDGNGYIVARSRDPERYVGFKAPDWERLKALRSDRGLFEAKTTEGFPVILTFRMLKGTPGWTVVVGEPLGVFNARWRDPLVGLATGVALALLLATGVALWIADQILSPVRALAARAGAMADGKEMAKVGAIPVSRIREFEALRTTFETTERALRMNERRYRSMAESGMLLVWRWRMDTRQMVINGWTRLTGLAEDGVSELGWLDRVHSEDRRAVRRAYLGTVRRRDNIDVEFRLLDRGGRWMWVRGRGGPVLDDDGRAVEWVGVVEDIDARMEAHHRVAHMAHHDALTGLGNRVLLRQRLEEATESRGGSAQALLLLDLDRFKSVNDTHGHGVGDALLRVVADRLRGCVAEGDTIVRLGGDEFAILHHASSPEPTATLAHRIVEAIGAPYEIDGVMLSIGISVGIAAVGGVSAGMDDHLRRADEALYHAKAAGRGQVCFHEQERALNELRRVGRAERRVTRLSRAG